MKLFELFATLALDTSEFDSGVSQSESRWNTFGETLSSGLSKVGNMAKSLYSNVFGGNIRAWIRDIADEASAAGDKIDKQSQALGMSRKAYQEWDYILSQSGASIDSLGMSMKTLNSAVLSDSKDTQEVFKALGLSMADLNGLTQESQLEKVVRAFQQLPAGADKSALAIKLFGRNGQDLLPLLNSSADSIDEMRARAQELGLIMSDDAIDAAVAYNDAIDDMDRTFKAVKYTVGAEFLPVMANMFRNVASYTGGLLNAYKEEGFSGVFKKIGSDIGSAMSNIPWPTWSDVKERFSLAWDGIKIGVAEKAKSLFGTDVFNIDFSNIGQTIQEKWNAATSTIGNLFFSVFHIPSWDEIKLKFQENVNSLIDGLNETFGLNLEHIGTDYAKDVTEAIDAQEQVGLRYAAKLEELQKAYGDGAIYTQVWQQTVENLKAMIPDLETSFGSENELLLDNTEALRDNIKAWADRNRQQALSDALSDQQASLAKAQRRVVDADINYQAAQNRLEAFRDKAVEMYETIRNAGEPIADVDLSDTKAVMDAVNQVYNSMATSPYISDVDIAKRLGFGDGDDAILALREFMSELGKFSQLETDIGNAEAEVSAANAALEVATERYNSYATAITDMMDAATSSTIATTSAVFSLNAALSGLSSSPAHAWRTGYESELKPGFATGLDYVPYNNFAANLHEGEAVLTKSEATAWRRGDMQTGVDLSALGEIVEAAIIRGMEGFGFYVDSQRLADATTEKISRNIADAAWAGRYAT